VGLGFSGGGVGVYAGATALVYRAG
jgi:hypothetical protein